MEPSGAEYYEGMILMKNAESGGSQNIRRAMTLARSHGLAIVKPSARPSTWTVFHERQIEDLQLQLRDADRNALAVMEWVRSLHFSQQRWKLASAIGWGFLGLLLIWGKK